jgi:hypothetical protein
MALLLPVSSTQIYHRVSGFLVSCLHKGKLVNLFSQKQFIQCHAWNFALITFTCHNMVVCVEL